MDVLPNVESNVTLGYTALMAVPPNVQSMFVTSTLRKHRFTPHSWMCHLMYSFFFVTSTLRKHWVTLHLWDGVPPNVQFIVCYLYLKNRLGYTALMEWCAT